MPEQEDTALTPDEVRRRVEAINVHDDEGAHYDQDNIWHDVLAAIAAGSPDPGALASEALKTDDLDFSRWYA